MQYSQFTLPQPQISSAKFGGITRSWRSFEVPCTLQFECGSHIICLQISQLVLSLCNVFHRTVMYSIIIRTSFRPKKKQSQVRRNILRSLPKYPSYEAFERASTGQFETPSFAMIIRPEQMLLVTSAQRVEGGLRISGYARILRKNGIFR